jgi:transcriptional regulator with XRE-family HTH domain
METPGQRLRKARKDLGMTLRDFATPLGVSFQSVHNWEKDLTPVPKVAAQAIEQVFKIPSGWILMGEDSAQPAPPQTLEQSVIPEMKRRHIKVSDLAAFIEGHDDNATAAKILGRLFWDGINAKIEGKQLQFWLSRHEACFLANLLIRHLQYSDESMPNE